MKKILFYFIVFLAFCNVCLSQQLLSMEEAVVKQKTSLAPDKMKQLLWVKNADKFSFVDIKNNEEVLIVRHAENKEQETVLTLAELNGALRTQNTEALKKFPQIQWQSRDQFVFETGKKVFSYDLKNKTTTFRGFYDLEKNAETQDVTYITDYLAYTVKNNLFVHNGKEKITVTNDTDENIVNGKSVHREEWGILKGTFWSPSGNLLAFYRMDQTMVTDYPVIDWTKQPALNNNIKYPMAGGKSHEVTVGIFNVSKRTTVFLKTGEPKEQYLTNIAWGPDEQHIYIAVLNRDQNHLKLNRYNAVSGDFEKTLFEEKNEKYVQPMHPLLFVPAHSEYFVWQSERDGYNHLYLYGISGKMLRQLTKGNWVITDFLGFDAKGEKAFYSATAESPVTRNIYCVELKNGKSTKITSGEGTHTAMLCSSGNYIIDNFQSTAVPREVTVYSTKGNKIQTVKTFENPLKNYLLGQMNIFTLNNPEGDVLFCRMYKPVHFDSLKKYPVIVYVYGGPNAQLINNTWNGGGDLWFQYMAERGFIVFSLDGRGSDNRGKAFEQATFRHLGTVEMHDQMTGIEYLKKQPYIDTTRMGLMGWSFGGFMTISVMTRYPGIFKTAVAGGPVTDWSYYEVMYTERYMDTPLSNFQGYDEANVMNHIDKLQGKLLLIHGTTDPVVVWQHSILFLKAAVDKGKQVDYFVYPGHEHNVHGKDREHLFRKITDYFMMNL